MNRKSLLLAGVLFVSMLFAAGIILAPPIQPVQASNLSNTSVVGWRQVNVDGFGNSGNEGIASLEVFNDELYAGIYNWGLGGSIRRTNNGTTWTNVYTNTNPAIADMVVFNNRIYASTAWGTEPGEIWRSGDGTNWTPIINDGFGDPNNKSIR